MQQLINPEMKNYRANLTIAEESELAGAYNYYYSLDAEIFTAVAALGYESNQAAIDAGETVYLDMWKMWGLQGCVDADGNECPQYVSILDETKYRNLAVAEGEEGDWISAADIYAIYGSMLDVGGDYASYCGIIVENENVGFDWDGVGFYKVDDYTVIYVTQSYIDLNTFMTSLTSNWLVYEPLYEAGKEKTGELVTTNYGTSKETTMSYGPYKFDSIDTGRQMKLSQNEHWYGWEEETDEEGNKMLVSYTNFEVDGEVRRQYMTTNIQIDVMDTATMEQAFMRGELSDWTPAGDQMDQFATSDYLYSVDETYTMSFFFNTDLDVLEALDADGTNTNGVVLSNYNFRKAMSLAINRDEYVTATQGYTPAYSLMNDLYYYDIYNDPTSIYRHTDEAMQAICSLYGVEYGEGTPYATLEEAYNSINGYNLTEAQALMKQACEELVAAGLYTAGEPIEIAIAWKQGAINSDDNAQVALLNRYINAAVEGSGFGTVTFTIVGNMKEPDNYEAVPQGLYAIGQGAWGGAAFYPFRNFQVYMDPDQYSINEDACWDPTTETLTLTIDGVEETMTWQEWSNCMTGSAKYAAASNETKLQITALLEEAYLKLYYRIPLMSTTICSLLSQQVEYYTQTYNIMYGFGGLRLMTYTYNDSDWAKYVADQGGTLNYE